MGIVINWNFGKLNFGVSFKYVIKDYCVLGYEDNYVFLKFENMVYFSILNFLIFKNLNVNYIE